MGKDIFIAGIGDEGQLDQDRWHVCICEDIQSVDAGRSDFYATVGGSKGIDQLALDAVGQHAATVTAGAGPGFCAVGFFGFGGITMDGYEDVGITGIGSFADLLQAVGLKQFCFYSCSI